MKTNFFIPLLVILLVVFTGCSKYSTCILWEEGDWDFSHGLIMNPELDSSLLRMDVHCNTVEVQISRETGWLYSKQMVKTLVDTLLHFVPKAKKIQIVPVQRYFFSRNTKAKGTYYVFISHKKLEGIATLVLFNGSQFILPPCPEQLIEVRRNKVASKNVQAERRSKRAAVIDNFREDDTKDDTTLKRDEYKSFLSGYWSYQVNITYYYY